MTKPIVLYEENEQSPYTPTVPDLGKLNMTIIEWIEEVITDNPTKDYMSSERDRGDPINLAMDEEDEYWTAIARSLNDEQKRALMERILELQDIYFTLREFRRKTEPNYLTKKETRVYIERRAKQGFNSWHAKREIRDGNLVLQ